jgi:hypothetical protein
VVGELVDDGVPDGLAQRLVVAGVGLERGAEQRDPVGKHEGVAAAALGERDALVQPEQVRLAGRRPILQDHLHVRHALVDPGREPVEGLRDELLEAFAPRAVALAYTHDGNQIRAFHASVDRVVPTRIG